MQLDELTREQLLDLVVTQAAYLEGARQAATVALAHANHLVGNYAVDVPEGKMAEYAKAQVDASAVLLLPSPVAPPATN